MSNGNGESRPVKDLTEKCIYSVYDRVAETYSPLFEAKNDGMAIRIVRDSFEKMPYDDVRLFRVGRVERGDGWLSFAETEFVQVEMPKAKEVKRDA